MGFPPNLQTLDKKRCLTERMTEGEKEECHDGNENFPALPDFNLLQHHTSGYETKAIPGTDVWNLQCKPSIELSLLIGRKDLHLLPAPYSGGMPGSWLLRDVFITYKNNAKSIKPNLRNS